MPSVDSDDEDDDFLPFDKAECMMSDANNDATDAAPVVNEADDLLHADADAEIPPSTSPATDAAAIIMETTTLTSSSTLVNDTPDGTSVNLPDAGALAEPPSPVEVKPTIATISAIVDEVRRKKISCGADIASIASQEVDRIFDAGTGQVGGGAGPSEQESYSLYNRKVRGGEWNGNKYSDNVDTETKYSNHSSFTSNTPQRTPINQTVEGESIMDDFSELCEELGIKDFSHPQLLRTTRRYQIIPGSIVRSTMCHYCMIITCLAGIALIVASAVTKGFDHVNRRNHLLHPAWVTEEETKKQAGKAWWVENGETDDLIAPAGSTTIDNSKRLSPDELDQLYYSLSDAFLPMWFDQTTGWNGASYAGAVKFCKSHYNFVPCPYEV